MVYISTSREDSVMNPDDNTAPTEPQTTTAPELGTPPTQAVPVDEVTQQPVTQPSSPTITDTISPEQPAPATPAQTVTPEAPASSGIVNATSPITDTTAVQPSVEDPGRTMGIIGLILAFFMPLIGLVVSIVARSKSKKAGHKNSLALAGIILSTVFIILTIAGVALFAFGANKTLQYCNENGAGTHTTEDGLTITCDQ